nr:DUF6577 family protein [Pseudoflavitalea rhizosphaerae]
MDTNWLCSISDGNLLKSIIVIEAEKSSLEEVFTLLLKNGVRELFLKPDRKTILRYVANAERPIILKPLLGRSPLQIFDNVYMPSLEKIIVDLWCDSNVYFGIEDRLATFYKSIIMNYTINFSKLMTYAKRRNQENEIKEQLLRVVGPELKMIIKKNNSLVNATL